MIGPSWVVRQFVKRIAQSAGADPFTSAIVSRAAGGLSSLIFHDHHTHFLPDKDENIDDDYDHDHFDSTYHSHDYDSNHHVQPQSDSSPSYGSNLDQVHQLNPPQSQIRSGSDPSDSPPSYSSNLDEVPQPNWHDHPSGYQINDHVQVTQNGSQHTLTIVGFKWENNQWLYHVKSLDENGHYDGWITHSQVIKTE
jgi:hypothetical protein